MRTFYLILSFVCLCDLLHAQTVRIAYEGGSAYGQRASEN